MGATGVEAHSLPSALELRRPLHMTSQGCCQDYIQRRVLRQGRRARSRLLAEQDVAVAPSLPRFPLFTFSLISPPTVLAAGGQGCDAALNWARRSEVWGIQKSNDLNTCGVASVAYVLGEVPQQDMALRGVQSGLPCTWVSNSLR